MTPAVSVVIPTVDRVTLLERCLRGLQGSQGVDFDVVVVHDGNPGVSALLDSFQTRLPLRGLRISERDAATKRNAGWRATTSAIVAFTDDDCQPAPGWLGAAVAALEPMVDLVQGRVVPHPEDAGVAGVFARTLTVDAPSELYANANLVYRRSALERVGGYDPAFWGGGEDTDLAWRVLETGGHAAYAPDALVWHAVRPADFLAHLRSLPRWATLPLVLRRHPQLRRLVHRRVFWKRSHTTAALALAGLLATPVDRRAAALIVPHLARRVKEAGAVDGARLAAADVVEVGVVLAGSARYRTLLV